MTEREHDTLVHRLLLSLGASPSTDLIQTHISSVIMAGPVVYKLKKPVDYGFLDYATLSRRKHFCEEEVRVNGRFAPQLYLGVVPVTGSIENPHFGGEGNAIEYAVKMRRFDPTDQLDAIVVREGLSDERCDAIADAAAAMHAAAEPVADESDFGSAQRVLQPMLENFDLMASLHSDGALAKAVAEVKAWSTAEHARLRPLLARRKANGFVRECHGDMHLHNMAIFDGCPMLFDAIEFNPYLNHIDVISDLAFLLMDLEYRDLTAQSRRILNRYLEITGDYESVALLPLYKTYRAMVRAKVLALHAAQNISGQERGAILSEIERYVALAAGYATPATPFLVIMHGLSGSGKSTFALQLVERFGAIRLRSDAERIRLLRKNGESGDIYTAAATTATYARLRELAEMLLGFGCAVVADATFLKYAQREQFVSLAKRRHVALLILDIVCDTAELKRRLQRRLSAHEDVSEADAKVLALQLHMGEPIKEEERRYCLEANCSETAWLQKVQECLRGGADPL